MESSYISFSLSIIFIYLITCSNSRSIVKNLPGFPGDLPFTLETGYIGVEANNESQLFYYFVESSRNPYEDPLLVYLTGGPGTSAFLPFLYQIGPVSIHFDNSTHEHINLVLNKNSWSKNANVLFFDHLAGVGYSYATTYEGTKSSDSNLAKQCYQFLQKWLVEHPTFMSNPLYLTGISYMGMLVPIVTLEAYLGNERGDQPQLNIKGCSIISPLTDKFGDFNSKLEFVYRRSLISDNIYESTKEACHGNYVYVDPENVECTNTLQRVEECTSRINEDNVLDPYCDELDQNPICPITNEIYLYYYGNDKAVQKVLNIREGTIEKFEKKNETIHYRYRKNDTDSYAYDILSSVIYHKDLLSRNCQVLILSADLDMTFPYVGTQQWIKSLNLPVESPWNPWFVNRQVAGYREKYVKNEYSLTYATVKGSGHSIPLNKPEEAWVILDGWLSSHTSLSDS
ncbi:serine carboxypeptidase-like 18 [Rutidosis leptorrhynchoides]|uniref:serine carboxypeptidase-like 18 n=1 Tax=Rutidosis leptorrhynchoides TaxID=125765 RepID=UPI003A99A7B9